MVKKEGDFVDSLIQFIFGNSEMILTPELLVRFMVFVLILSCISNLASAAFNIGGR